MIYKIWDSWNEDDQEQPARRVPREPVHPGALHDYDLQGPVDKVQAHSDRLFHELCEGRKPGFIIARADQELQGPDWAALQAGLIQIIREDVPSHPAAWETEAGRQ